jgi:hypothetical protein
MPSAKVDLSQMMIEATNKTSRLKMNNNNPNRKLHKPQPIKLHKTRVLKMLNNDQNLFQTKN